MLCVNLTFFTSKNTTTVYYTNLCSLPAHENKARRVEETMFFCCCTLDWLTITLCRTLFFIVWCKISSVIKLSECKTIMNIIVCLEICHTITSYIFYCDYSDKHHNYYPVPILCIHFHSCVSIFSTTLNINQLKILRLRLNLQSSLRNVAIYSCNSFSVLWLAVNGNILIILIVWNLI